MIGIYKIENIVNHKMYIGKTIDFNSRLYLHLHYLRNNRHPNKYLQRSWNKYGSDNFKVELFLDLTQELFNKDQEEVDNRLNYEEKYWIKYFKTSDENFGFNLSEGGDGATLFGKRNPCYGKSRTDAVKSKISNTILKNKSHAGEHNGRYGRPTSAETRKKIGDSNRGRIQSEEERKMRCEAMRRANQKIENIQKRELRKADPVRKQLYAEYGKARRKYSDEFVRQIRSEYKTDEDIKILSEKYNLRYKLVMEMVHHNGHFKYR